MFPAVEITVPDTILGSVTLSIERYYCFLSPLHFLMMSHPDIMISVTTMLKAKVPNTEAEAGSNIFYY